MINSNHEERKCCRCLGTGDIKAFSHILGGVCFRCWGTGSDPSNGQELEAWLAAARKEFRQLRASGKENTTMARQLVVQGRKNARKLAALQADATNCRDFAISTYA